MFFLHCRMGLSCLLQQCLFCCFCCLLSNMKMSSPFITYHSSHTGLTNPTYCLSFQQRRDIKNIESCDYHRNTISMLRSTPTDNVPSNKSIKKSINKSSNKSTKKTMNKSIKETIKKSRTHAEHQAKI
jgi:hypothetical protein